MNEISNIYKQCINSTRNNILSFNWTEEAYYKEWLAQTFYYASYSTRIIGMAGCKFNYDKNELHLKFIDHLKEEKNHEKILISDLKSLNSDIKNFEPCYFSELIYQIQYYWVHHISPLSVFGYFLFLEGLAAEFGGIIYQKLLSTYPENSCKYLKIHTEEDPGHIEQHYKFFSNLNEIEIKQIMENMKQCAFLYNGMLNEINQKLNSINKNLAA